jgi:hypothetical protein
MFNQHDADYLYIFNWLFRVPINPGREDLPGFLVLSRRNAIAFRYHVNNIMSDSMFVHKIGASVGWVEVRNPTTHSNAVQVVKGALLGFASEACSTQPTGLINYPDFLLN